MRNPCSQLFTHTPKISLPSLALLAWMVGQPAAAQEELNFTDLSGNGATGHLILGAPLTTPQHPLGGSFFDPDGPAGPIPNFDLTLVEPGVWLGGISLETLVGEIPASPTGLLSLLPSPHFIQGYVGKGPTAAAVGTGMWSVAPAAPDTAGTSTLFIMSLAALGVAARRFRPVAR
jgi:hypothetical protein